MNLKKNKKNKKKPKKNLKKVGLKILKELSILYFLNLKHVLNK